MRLTYSYLVFALATTIATAIRAAPTVYDESLASRAPDHHHGDPSNLKHPASACGGKTTWGRIGPSGCKYTGRDADSAKEAELSLRAMRPDSSPKRTEAQRKEGEEDLGRLKSLAFEDHPVSQGASRQDEGLEEAHQPRTVKDFDGQAAFPHLDHQGGKAALEHDQWSQYSSPWLEVTDEAGHSTLYVKEAKHEHGENGSDNQEEHLHRHHHHEEARDKGSHEAMEINTDVRREANMARSLKKADSHSACKDHEHVHHQDDHGDHTAHAEGHDKAGRGKKQQKPDGNSYALQNYTW
ncbi:hypothetical protein BCV69DRAFT_298119 [Microstroma glucosiphilum]|uniref:Uncharacterized protein n=1 Tax=Pseudomicrostroma glucosiphilum TaxID=1684307 RepID=A0A316UAP0_9BASI|nr:hypothetical protein BCV69DRAFT_298119 [Pseudomicrostroma glucosiphilum]PWN21918.1 hypothetical protein BCV69DRAFT_298119 [Pseudomicrostroma glucosiphilum]